MSYAEDFGNQWKGLCDYLQSEMIKSCDQEGVIHLNNIKTAFQTEKNRWFTSGQYNSAWLETLRRARPEVAGQFEQELRQATLQQEMPAKKPSASKHMLPSAAAALVGFGVPKLIGLSAGWILGATLGLTAITAGTGFLLYRQRQEQNLAGDRQAYIRQLMQKGDRLRSIVAQADQ